MKRLKKKTVYMKLIISISLISTFIILTIATIGFSLYNKHYAESLMENHVKTLKYEAKVLATDAFDKAGSIYYNMLFGKAYSQALAIPSGDSAPNKHVSILRAHELMLSILSTDTPLIKDIIIYYPSDNFVLSAIMGYKDLNEPRNSDFSAMIDGMPTLTNSLCWWQTGETTVKTIQTDDILFGGKAPWRYDDGKQALVICVLSTDWLIKRLDNMAIGGQSAYLISENGNAVVSNMGAEALPQLTESEWGKNLLESSGKLKTAAGARDHQALYSLLKIGSTPYSLMLKSNMAEFEQASLSIAKVMLLAIVICIFIGIPIIIIISRQLYSPLRQLMELASSLPFTRANTENAANEYDALHCILDDLSLRLGTAQRLLYINKPAMRQMLLRNLLENDYDTPQRLTDSLQFTDIKLNRKYYCVLIMAWPFVSDNVLSSASDRQALRFVLLEKLENSLSDASSSVYGYTESPTRLTLLLLCDDTSQMALHTLTGIAREMLAAVQTKFFCTISPWYEDYSRMTDAYKQAQLMFGIRFFVADSEDIITTVNTDTPQTNILEQQYASSLAARNVPKALDTLKSILEALKTSEPDNSHMALRRIGEITMREARKQTDIPDFLLAPTVNMWAADEYIARMRELLDEWFCNESEHEQLIYAATVKFICDHLNEELSLDIIAEHMHFSAKYFSYLFKQIAGMGINSYIQNERMKKAEELLLETDNTVEQISRDVGFNSVQYFMRKFKDTHGCTPRDWRINGKL